VDKKISTYLDGGIVYMLFYDAVSISAVI